VEGGRERSDPNRPTYTMPYTTALNPNPYDPFAPTTTTPGVTTHVASQSYGIDFLDTMDVNRWLQLSGGVRFDYFSTTSQSPQSGATAATFGERLDKQPTYRAAVVVKPKAEGSVYFDWGTSFDPAAESLSLSGNNAISPPEYNETYELGAKWEFLHEKLNLNGSLFRTEKLNARETDPTNSLNIENAGNQLVRGAQIGALGHMPASFDLIVGYAYLDGEVEKSILNASPFVAINNVLLAAGDPRANTAPFFLSPKGYPLANVPKNSGNLWVTHKLFYGFVGGFGGNYVGARRASSTALVGVYNTQALLDPATVAMAPKAVAGYTSLNLMLKRNLGEHLNLQVNIVNLTNAFFIDQPHPGHLVPSEGRNAQFGINYKF
jgi:catecholate siderophore receptor